MHYTPSHTRLNEKERWMRNLLLDIFRGSIAGPYGQIISNFALYQEKSYSVDFMEKLMSTLVLNQNSPTPWGEHAQNSLQSQGKQQHELSTHT